MDALELLRSQHAEIGALFGKIENAAGHPRREHFNELADKLAAHTRIEQALFYPAVMAEQTEARIRESAEEHLAIKQALAELSALDIDGAQFDATLAAMKAQAVHHVHEEEGPLFAQARQLLSAAELEAMGGKIHSMIEELRAAGR
jgi:hypothetical protein